MNVGMGEVSCGRWFRVQRGEERNKYRRYINFGLEIEVGSLVLSIASMTHGLPFVQVPPATADPIEVLSNFLIWSRGCRAYPTVLTHSIRFLPLNQPGGT